MNEEETRQLLDRLGLMVPDRPTPLARLVTEATRVRRKRRRVLIGIAAGAATLVVGAGAVALGSNPATRATDPAVSDQGHTPAPSPPSSCPPGVKYAPEFREPLVSKPPFPTNANGQTYGSDAGV